MRTPRSRRQSSVRRQSSARRKLLTVVTPEASAPMIAARCEMDLSPGRRQRPLSCAAGVTVMSIAWLNPALPEVGAERGRPAKVDVDDLFLRARRVPQHEDA